MNSKLEYARPILQGMDNRFWKEWDKDHDMMRRCDMLMTIDRLSYDHAVSWIENARHYEASLNKLETREIKAVSKKAKLFERYAIRDMLNNIVNKYDNPTALNYDPTQFIKELRNLISKLDVR